jgi:hypothetical protein
MKKKGTKASKRAKVEKLKTNQSENAAQDPEKLFDFGGLPNRDLKKNLGCG